MWFGFIESKQVSGILATGRSRLQGDQIAARLGPPKSYEVGVRNLCPKSVPGKKPGAAHFVPGFASAAEANPDAAVDDESVVA
jgi:hypothetical protein